MGNEKRKGGESNSVSGTKWTNSQQKRLEPLMGEGTLSSTDTAAKVKECDGAFSPYSNNVIGYHLGQLRKKKLQVSSAEGGGRGGPVHDVLKQFGVTSPNSSTVISLIDDKVEVSGAYELVCERMPFVRYNYMKYDCKQEKVVVLLDLPGGSGNYVWEFNENGDGIIVIVNWSKGLYDVSNLFKCALQTRKLTLDHPKLHALQNEILKQGFSSKQIPQCRIHVYLGKRVQTDDTTWEVDMFQHDDNKILMFEFSGFSNSILDDIGALEASIQKCTKKLLTVNWPPNLVSTPVPLDLTYNPILYAQYNHVSIRKTKITKKSNF